MSGKIISNNKEAILTKYVNVWVEKQGMKVIQFSLIILAIFIALTVHVYAQLDINTNTIPNFPTPDFDVVSNVSGDANLSLIVENAWLLNGSNAPPTANWNMGGFGFINLVQNDFIRFNDDVELTFGSDSDFNITWESVISRLELRPQTEKNIEILFQGANNSGIFRWQQNLDRFELLDHFQLITNEFFFLGSNGETNITFNNTDLVIDTGIGDLEVIRDLDVGQDVRINGLLGSNDNQINLNSDTNITWSDVPFGCLFWERIPFAFSASICSPSSSLIDIFAQNINLRAQNVNLGLGIDTEECLAYDVSGADGSLCYQSDAPQRFNTGGVPQPIEFSTWFGSSIPNFFRGNVSWRGIASFVLDVNALVVFHGNTSGGENIILSPNRTAVISSVGGGLYYDDDVGAHFGCNATNCFSLYPPTIPTQIIDTNVTTECSSDEVLLGNSSCMTITKIGGSTLDIKSGFESAVDNIDTSVLFNTFFSSTPHIVGTFTDEQNANDVIELRNISVSGFIIAIQQGHGGGAHTHNVSWIATNTGNP